VKPSARPIRRLAAFAAVVGSVVLLGGPAWAHVTVQPSSAVKGSYQILSFSVPNESDTASTTQIAVEIPTKPAIQSVSIQPKPGWTYTVEKSGDLVSKITWSGGEIKPGEFDLFVISAGPLPTKGKSIVFPATQTYSDGEVVEWNEKTPAGGSEPEHPAPTLKLTSKKSTSEDEGGH
jgi:periplasmic copper chaperone A